MHPLAQVLDPLEEFTKDPILTVACVLLIFVSVGWVVLARLIARNLKKAAAARTARPASRKKGAPSKAKDVWNDPP